MATFCPFWEGVCMYLTKKQKFILVSVFIILLGLIGVCIYLHWARPPSTVKQMTQTEFKNTSTLAKSLNVDTDTASEIETAADKAQAKTPAAEYYETGSTVHEAATTTAEKIENDDSSLPAAATEKTDRTAVVENTDKQKVDVYKINLRNNHKIKAGISYIDSKAYADVGYQAGRVEVIGHYGGENRNGVSVMYTLKEW